MGAGDDTASRIPPPLVYVAGFLAAVGLEIAFPLGSLPLGVAIAAGIAGAGLWLLLDPAAMILFQRAGTGVAPSAPTNSLVTTGPYRITRNPMYLGMTFLYLGLALAFGVFWALATLVPVLVAIDRIARREERLLDARFGEEYRRYAARVRRWI